MDDFLCDEHYKDLCFVESSNNPHNSYNDDVLMRSELSGESDEEVVNLLERETDYLAEPEYLQRLRCGDLDLGSRIEAFNWIFKVHSYYSFGPLTLCLALNYLDRFFSARELPRDKAWTVQLLAVACISIASKIEETCVPLSIEFQVGDPKYVFEAKTIQRMELLVLDTLKWKLNVVTPCSFLHYSLNKLIDPHSITDKFLFSTTKVVNRSMQLILCTIKGIDYLEFKPSEIAAGVAISVAAEIQAVDIKKACSCFIHLEKGRVLKCVDMIKEMSQNSCSIQQGIPLSPIGVLDAGCFSYKSDELTSSRVGSCSNSSKITTSTTTTTTTTSPDAKRMKLDHTLTLDS